MVFTRKPINQKKNKLILFIIIAFVNIISKWKTCMKLGFNVFEKPIEEYFEYATEHGLNHLEIDLIKDHSLITKFTSKRIYSLKKLAKDYKITLSLHTPYTINPADRRSSFRDETTAYLIQFLCFHVHKYGLGV